MMLWSSNNDPIPSVAISPKQCELYQNSFKNVEIKP